MQSEANILTNAGIDHRINRSIQAEGAFSKLKDGLGYTRFPAPQHEKSGLGHRSACPGYQPQQTPQQDPEPSDRDYRVQKNSVDQMQISKGLGLFVMPSNGIPCGAT